MTEDAGKGYVVASIGEASGEIPYTAYFAKRSYIKENEDIIQGFTNAVYKGQMWVKEHTAAEIAEVIQNFFPDTKLEMLTRSIQSYMDIDAWNDTPVLKEEAFNRLQTVMKEAGELEKEAPYNQVVNNKYAEETIKNYQK
jgi:NitT/TauT family transport system substrate-binding protein